MVGAGKCSRAACFWSILRSLLFPLLPGAMWWLWVSAHRMGSELDLSFPLPLTPSPSLLCGRGLLAPSWGTMASLRGTKVPKGALGWALITCQQYRGSGELELAPHCHGPGPASSGPTSTSLVPCGSASSDTIPLQHLSLLGLRVGWNHLHSTHSFLQSHLGVPQRNTVTQNTGLAGR